MNLFNKLSKWIKVKLTSEEASEKEKDFLEYKVLVLGERLTGKSSICLRFTMNEFNLEIKPTSQSECFSKNLKLFEQIIKLYIIDIDEHVMSNDRSYLYSDVNGALVVYDITKSKSFEKVDNWVLDARQNSSNSLPIVLVGNKSDLNFLRNVDYEEGLDKANSLNCEFMETSCIDMDSVKEAFKLLIAKIYYHDLPESKKNYFKIYLSSNISSVNQLQGPNNSNNTDSTTDKDNTITNVITNKLLEEK
jgi:Ras-related protein Rab-11A